MNVKTLNVWYTFQRLGAEETEEGERSRARASRKTGRCPAKAPSSMD